MKKNILLLAAAMLFSVASALAQSGTTGPLTWNINNGKLTISGEGAMPDYSPNNYYYAPWHRHQEYIDTIVMETGVTSIGNYAFYYCTSPTLVIIPNSVTSIGDHAFYSCIGLTSVTIPDNVTSIGDLSFYFTKLTSITIPNSVINIGYGVFFGCYGLELIEVESGNKNYASENGVLFNHNKTTLICCPARKTGAYVIPNSVTWIENGSFSHCENLTSIAFPENITSIGHYTFDGCKSLTSITLPDGVITIGNIAFASCTNLTSVTLPNSVTSIGESAFFGCKNLSSVTLSNSLTSIRDDTFYECHSLTSIIIPNSVTSIGRSAFYYCYSLTSVTLPNNLISIEKWAFSGCESLTLITNFNPIPISINPSVFGGMPQFICTLEVPINSVSAYQNANVWKEFNIVGIEVGIEPIETDVVKIYPNPTRGELRVESGEWRVESVEIFDIFGRSMGIAHPRAFPPSGELKGAGGLEGLPSGIYFVRIQTEKGTITRKVVKN
jgi:hypothetical protein